MNPSAESYEILRWDSSVFGFPVARLRATSDRDALSVALDDARRTGVQLAYLSTEHEAVARSAESLGGTPISKRVTFLRGLTELDVDRTPSRAGHPVVVEQWSGYTPTPELLQLARDAGRYSRFRVDPRVPVEVFERIYDAWITSSVSGQIAEEVLVTRDRSSLTGLVTVGTRNRRGEIGLLAVREDARGQGLGKRLVQAALEWAVRRHFREAQVITQQANAAACRLYESCGYGIERSEHVFHFWL